MRATDHLADAASQTFLQLTGHPLRWQLLSALAHSDRMVQELTALTGEPQNLVSYHLAKLRDGGLVSARRSAADRRDAYYTADLARIGSGLSAAGGALHPGLHLVPPPAPKLAAGTRILFLCTGNSARSPIAAALAKARSGGAIEASNAGSAPKPIHPNAVKVMRAQGIDLSRHIPKHFDAFKGRTFDCVISLCDRVREVCPGFPGSEAIHWSIVNPATGEGDSVTYPLFKQTVSELTARIDYLLPALSERTPATPKRGRKP